MRLIVSVAFVLLLSAWARGVDVPLDARQSFLKFTGHAFLHDFNGEAKQFSGAAQIDPQKPELVTGAKLIISAARLTTFEDARDKNMRDWLHVDANPEISFKLARVVATKGDPAAATKDQPCAFTVTGDFTLNKTTRPIEAQALGWREGRLLVVTGSTQIDTTAYGLPIVRQFFLTVDKRVDVSFRLVFALPG